MSRPVLYELLLLQGLVKLPMSPPFGGKTRRTWKPVRTQARRKTFHRLKTAGYVMLCPQSSTTPHQFFWGKWWVSGGFFGYSRSAGIPCMSPVAPVTAACQAVPEAVTEAPVHSEASGPMQAPRSAGGSSGVHQGIRVEHVEIHRNPKDCYS